MKLKVFLSVFCSLFRLFSQSDWSGKLQVTAIQGESTTLVWIVNLTDSDINKAWTYVKIFHAEGSSTMELVTFKRTGEKTIDNPSYRSRLSDFIFNVSQSGSAVTIRFIMENLARTTDMKSYKAMLGFGSDTSIFPSVTVLTILVKPHSTEFKLKPEKNTFCLKDKVNFTCKADGIPPAQVSLFLNNQLLQRKNTSVTLTLSLNVKGENNFICVPNNTAGIGQTRNVQLVVKEPPKIARCTINNEEVTSKSVKEDTKVTLSCQVTGSEPLSIDWYKDNVQTPLSQSNTLTFGSILRRDSGQYRVTVYNGRECETTVTKIFHVTVMYLGKPVIQGNAYKVVSPKNREVQFKIVVDANPHPRLTCHREGIPGNLSVVRSVSGSISTFSVNIYVNSHILGNEEYMCSVKNTVGTRHIKCNLYKRIPPLLKKGTFTITNMSWKEDLNRANSDSYASMKSRVTHALNLVYESEEFVSTFQILGFAKGSVAVNFELHIIANVTDPDKDPIFLLKNAVEKNGGQLNGLMINPASIKEGYSVAKKDADTAGRPSTESADDNQLKLGLGLGLGLGIPTILGLFILIYRGCSRVMTLKDTIERKDSDGNYEKRTRTMKIPGGHSRHGISNLALE